MPSKRWAMLFPNLSWERVGERPGRRGLRRVSSLQPRPTRNLADPMLSPLSLSFLSMFEFRACQKFLSGTDPRHTP